MYHYKEEPPTTNRICEAEGCTASGDYKAPKSRDDPARNYCWFCLEHVREYNRQWDYFAGMNQEEIECFQKDAVTGHRPTWRYQMSPDTCERKLHRAAWEQGFFQTTPDEPAGSPHPPSLPQEYRRALETLELDFPTTLAVVKARYKTLVKRYHPDMNGGDPAAEERFKCVTQAYDVLRTHHREDRNAATG